MTIIRAVGNGLYHVSPPTSSRCACAMRAPVGSGPRRAGKTTLVQRLSTSPNQALEGITLGALIMLGTLLGLIVLIFALVLRYDPEARGPSESNG